MAPRKNARASTPIDPATLTPAELIGYEIVSRHADLTPSVDRILKSTMSEAGRLHAITLFRDSLGQPGDPNRHPATAIAAGLALEGEAGLALEGEPT